MGRPKSELDLKETYSLWSRHSGRQAPCPWAQRCWSGWCPGHEGPSLGAHLAEKHRQAAIRAGQGGEARRTPGPSSAPAETGGAGSEEWALACQEQEAREQTLVAQPCSEWLVSPAATIPEPWGHLGGKSKHEVREEDRRRANGASDVGWLPAPWAEARQDALGVPR